MANSATFTHNPLRVTPPMKGSFPLDRKGWCKTFMNQWAECIVKNKNNNSICRPQAAAYLKCRSEHNLMAPEEPAMLGFTEEEWNTIQSPPSG
ncbi:CHCH domain protein [Opisthorchis viverrini]|uniref:CHCH domain protein n=1 Tax=Opisthorchis viverrini TaxID=6198 RepID=A0A1S8X4D9_OPIVI|nr:CHCH domain protein [Opisthorchis viverrini]